VALKLISDHVFRGERRCLYPGCGHVDGAHVESVESRTPQVPHWFVGLRLCLFCKIGFNHPSHCLSPRWVKVVTGS
jgi:hypothetical protein